MKNYDVIPKNIPDNITFCTMCFNIGGKKVDKIKKEERKYQDFYLKSLEKLITRYKRVVLWCDQETADFIKSKDFDVYIKIMKFEENPFYKKRDEWLGYLKKMQSKNCNGLLFQKLQPEEIIDYLIVVFLKIEIIKWAKDNNFYNSEYFYWMDAGGYNQVYDYMWNGFDGIIDVKTDKFKCAFMTDYKGIYKSLIDDVSYEDISLSNNVPFEIAGTVWVINYSMVDEFYEKYHEAIKFLNKKGLIASDQAIFSVMLKMGYYDLFEFSKTIGYEGIYNAVAKSNMKQKIVEDKYRIKIKLNKLLLLFINFLKPIFKLFFKGKFKYYIKSIIYK